MKKKILVIDDSPFVFKQLKEILSSENYELLDFARSGEEGLELYDKLKPDLVILDIIMPGIDGLETATIIKERNPDAKIVMLSSLCDEDTIEEVKDIGAERLVPKPFDGEYVKEILKEILG